MISTQDPLLALEKSLDTDFFKVLSEPSRVALIRVLLQQRKADIGTIASHMDQDRSVVSRHLKVMLQHNLVIAEKQGRHTHYCLNGDGFVQKLEKVLALVKSATGSDCC